MIWLQDGELSGQFDGVETFGIMRRKGGGTVVEKPRTGASGARPDVADQRRRAAAERALEEAAARRRLTRGTGPSSPEIDGRGGADPVRYGDWEVKGLAVDF